MTGNNKCYFDNGDECSALKSKDCEKCCFRKTEAEYFEGQAKAKARLIKIGRVNDA